ncbi:MAG: hypothetical protein KatS3mg118_3054 [Paracoccaceae bacterium]|nr:MAG: hypothetical protein KatS3mg118_3054 [Paracoccaceae bacterium]
MDLPFPPRRWPVRRVGARARATFRRASLLSSLWGLGCVGGAGAGLRAGRRAGDRPDGHRSGGAGRGTGASALDGRRRRWRGLAAWMLDGIFIGATATRDMRNAMILSVAVFAVAAAALIPPSAITGCGRRWRSSSSPAGSRWGCAIRRWNAGWPDPRRRVPGAAAPTASARVAWPLRCSSASSPRRMRGDQRQPLIAQGGVDLHRAGAGADAGEGFPGRIDPPPRRSAAAARPDGRAARASAARASGASGGPDRPPA